jgi:KDO2-lipid IV(A) lauroyltransferase
MEYIFYKIACFLSAHLPFRATLAIAWIAAMSKYVCLPGLRRTITANLRGVFDYRKAVTGAGYTRKDLRRAVRRVYANFGFYIADFFHTHRWTAADVRKHVKIVGQDILDDACARGNGIVVLTAHLGNWELAGIVTSLLGYPMNAVALHYRNRRVNSIFAERREKKGVHVIFTGTNPKELLKVFQNNGIVAMLGDRLFTEKGFEVEFLGRKTLLPRGPATLVVRKRTAYIAGFLVREKKGFTFKFEDIPAPAESLSEDEKIQAFVANGARF